jgi:predicted dehydrogenase
MKLNRRDFLKYSSLGAGSLIHRDISHTMVDNGLVTEENVMSETTKDHQQHFNMCGYRAPKLGKVRMAFIGIGNRGYANLGQMLYLQGVEINALCDLRQSRIDKAQQLLSEYGYPKAKEYGGTEDKWKEVCELPNIDLILIAVPRGPLHARISIYAMKCGKHVAVEVPAISTLDEAWELVETSETTRKHCMMLENCCYDFFELLTLNMIRQGLLGELIHADASYIHSQDNFTKNQNGDMWRLKESQEKNGNLYPTHGLGPVAQAMNINRGDRFTHMTSMSSDDFMMGKRAAELAQSDPFYKPFDTNSYKGNMNTSVIRTEKGCTIMLQYDTTSPRVYSRIHMISVTKGAILKYPDPPRINLGHEWVDELQMKSLTEQYIPPLIKKVGDMAKHIGGHGGMDFLMSWRLVDCLHNGLPLDQDVYDAALWSVITPLSEWSIANSSKPVDIPDFTCGSYRNNKPVDLSLSEGGNTEVTKT